METPLALKMFRRELQFLCSLPLSLIAFVTLYLGWVHILLNFVGSCSTIFIGNPKASNVMPSSLGFASFLADKGVSLYVLALGVAVLENLICLAASFFVGSSFSTCF